MTPYPWRDRLAELLGWGVTNLDAAHAPVLRATNTLMVAFVPAAVQFAVNAIPRRGFFANLSAGIEADDVRQIGENVKVMWEPAFDAAWDWIVTALRTGVDKISPTP